MQVHFDRSPAFMCMDRNETITGCEAVRGAVVV